MKQIRSSRFERLGKLDQLRLDQALESLRNVRRRLSAAREEYAHALNERNQELLVPPSIDSGIREQSRLWLAWSATETQRLENGVDQLRSVESQVLAAVQHFSMRVKAWDKLLQRLAQRELAAETRLSQRQADEMVLVTRPPPNTAALISTNPSTQVTETGRQAR